MPPVKPGRKMRRVYWRVFSEKQALERKAYRERRAAELAERARIHDDRVEYVADLMRDLKFRTGVTHKALAVEWSLPISAVSKITVAASRIVRAELTDPDRVVSKITRALDWVIDDAIAGGDRHAIIKAAQVWAQVSGVNAPTRISLSQDLSALTPEALQARKAEILRRMRETSSIADAEIVEAPALPEAQE